MQSGYLAVFEMEKRMACKILNMGSTACITILLDILHNKQPEMLTDREGKVSSLF